MTSTHKPMSDGGKGSVRRNEDNDAYRNNFDSIFRKNKTKTMMNDDDDDKDFEEHSSSDHEDGEWLCDLCGGEMYSAKHWSYGRCENCDATQEKLNDDYL